MLSRICLHAIYSCWWCHYNERCRNYSYIKKRKRVTKFVLYFPIYYFVIYIIFNIYYWLFNVPNHMLRLYRTYFARTSATENQFRSILLQILISVLSLSHTHTHTHTFSRHFSRLSVTAWPQLSFQLKLRFCVRVSTDWLLQNRGCYRRERRKKELSWPCGDDFQPHD